jgi:hypothetical protein
MNMARVDFFAGAFLCVFGIVIYFAAPLTVDEYNEMGLTPSSFPCALSAAIAVLSALLCWNGWRNRDRDAVRQGVDDGAEDGESHASPTPYVIAAIAVMGLYIVGMPLFGYLLATSATLLMLSIIYGNRRWRGLVIAAAVAPPALFFFFQDVMIILLPEASLF